MFNNKKRKDTTYLKMRDGKIINTPNPYSTNEDVEMDNENKSFHEFNAEVKQKELNPQNKKSKLLIVVGLMLILLPLIVIGFQLGKTQISQLQEYMILGDKEVEDPDKNTSTESITISKSNISKILEITNTVNTSLKTTYSGIKTDVILFADNKESLYVTRKKFKSRQDIVIANKEYIVSKQSVFVKYEQEQLYDLFIKRFDLLLETINSFSTDINRTSSIEITNNAIIEDNILLDNEILIIENLLKANKIEYTETENGILIKE